MKKKYPLSFSTLSRWGQEILHHLKQMWLWLTNSNYKNCEAECPLFAVLFGLECKSEVAAAIRLSLKINLCMQCLGKKKKIMASCVNSIIKKESKAWDLPCGRTRQRVSAKTDLQEIKEIQDWVTGRWLLGETAPQVDFLSYYLYSSLHRRKGPQRHVEFQFFSNISYSLYYIWKCSVVEKNCLCLSLKFYI